MTKHRHNLNLNETHCDSQRQQILEFLLTGCGLTCLQALRYFNCFRLSGRIYELNQDGWNIQKEMITTEEGKKVARYYL